jgi:O-antigen/teichoic acid export membrane protein
MVLVIYAARMLGAREWGVFSYAFSLGSLLMIFGDVGISNLVTRELGRQKDDKYSLISGLLVVKGFLLLVSSLGIMVIGPYISHIKEANTLLPAIAIVFMLDSLRELGFAINRSYERMEREMATKTIMGVLTLGIGIILLKSDASSAMLLWIYMIGSGVGCILIFLMIQSHLRKLCKKLTTSDIRAVLSTIAPFSLVAICTIVMSNIDIYMLGIWNDPVEIGLYNAVQRIYQISIIIPTAVASATLPLMSQLAHTNRGTFSNLIKDAILSVSLVSVPFAIGSIALSKEIIVRVFGNDFAASYQTFSIFSLVTVVSSIFLVISNAIFAHNKQKSLAIAYGVGMTVNILLNIFLIRSLGAEGAAISVLVSTLVTTLIVWQALRKVNRTIRTPKLARVIASSGIMLAAILVVRSLGVTVVPTILCAVVSYMGALILFKEPLLQDFRRTLRI